MASPEILAALTPNERATLDWIDSRQAFERVNDGPWQRSWTYGGSRSRTLVLLASYGLVDEHPLNAVARRRKSPLRFRSRTPIPADSRTFLETGEETG